MDSPTGPSPEDLKACPYCKSNRLALGYFGQPSQYFFITCCDCNAQGPQSTKGQYATGGADIGIAARSAAELWNGRA